MADKLVVNLSKAAQTTRLAAMAARRSGQITQAFVCQSGDEHRLAFSADFDSDLSVLVRQGTTELETFKSAASATREAQSIGFPAGNIHLIKVTEPTEEDKVRAAVLRLFAWILPGDPRRSDKALISEVVLKADTRPRVTLCGDLTLRRELENPQCFEKDISHDGNWVFSVEGYTFALKLLYQERRKDDNYHAVYWVTEIEMSSRPIHPEAISYGPD